MRQRDMDVQMAPHLERLRSMKSVRKLDEDDD